MGLNEYKRKRTFSRTPEPAGKPGARKKAALSYVIQKHAATRLHYDLRLELDGVLKSWAVPKGPSLDPGVRALAVEVEDHPLDYATFEGVIPEGNYGAGEVIVWDRGRWQPLGEPDPRPALRKGHLKFRLEGKKLQGEWTLTRMKRRDGETKDNWLLIKHRDDTAIPDDAYGITERLPRSIKSGKKIEDLADPKRARKKAARKSPIKKVRAGSPALTSPERKRGDSAPPATSRSRSGLAPLPSPGSISPQLATLVDEPPAGPEWVHELKFDGYRLLAFKDGDRAVLMTRNGHDWTHRFLVVAAAIKKLPAENAILDGEVVALNEHGVPDFQSLQNAIRDRGGARLSYYLFDLLFLDGSDLRPRPLRERKDALRALLRRAPDMLQFSEHFADDGTGVLKTVCTRGYEGVVSKRLDAPYVSGRARQWTKTRCGRGQEFVIGGYTDPGGSRTGFGSLLIGYYEGGELRYVGRVGTGFDEAGLAEMTRKLKAIEVTQPPFAGSGSIPGKRQAHWVRPELVAQVTFTEMTSDGVLRHPVFHGLRQDKPAKDVRLERAAHVRGGASAGVIEEKPMATRKTPAPRSQATKPARSAGPPRNPPRGGGLPKADRPVVAGVGISSPDRLVFPGTAITKLDLARYYEGIADLMLPHVAGRPLMLVRCPEGEGRECFHQRHWTKMMPPQISGVKISENDGGAGEPHAVITDAGGLVALVQMGVLEIHPWGCRVDAVETPDRLVFDLDPGPGVPWRALTEAGVLVRAELRSLGLESWPRLTGGKGLHVVVPLRPTITWDPVKAFCKAVVERVAAAAPAAFTTNMAKSKRDGRIFLDYLRNGRTATAVGTFSTRARPGAPVCVPVSWKQLAAQGDERPEFSPGEVLARKRRWAPAWKGFDSARQSITKGALREVGRTKS